jgi:hypothetical protein
MIGVVVLVSMIGVVVLVSMIGVVVLVSMIGVVVESCFTSDRELRSTRVDLDL